MKRAFAFGFCFALVLDGSASQVQAYGYDECTYDAATVHQDCLRAATASGETDDACNAAYDEDYQACRDLYQGPEPPPERLFEDNDPDADPDDE